MRESIARATATAGGAVFFAGGTVVIALVSLLASGIPLVGTMGYCAAVAVVVAVLAAITLLPALLGALGCRINSLRVKLGPHPSGRPRAARLGPLGARRGRSPVALGAARIVILAVLAVPVLNLQLGSSDDGELPKSTTARQAYDLITEGFGAGANGPLLISVKLGRPRSPTRSSSTRSTKQKQQQQKDQQQSSRREQLEAEGVPPSGSRRPSSRSRSRPSQQSRSSRTRRSRPSHRPPTPRLTDPRERDQEGRRTSSRCRRPTRRQGRHSRGVHGHSQDGAVRPRDRGPREAACAPT